MVNSKRRKSEIDPPTFSFLDQQQQAQPSKGGKNNKKSRNKNNKNKNNAMMMTAIIEEEEGNEVSHEYVDLEKQQQQQYLLGNDNFDDDNDNYYLREELLNDDDETFCELFWSYYFWQLLAWVCVMVSIAAIAVQTKPTVVLMSTVAILICVQVIVRRSKIRQWDELYTEYEYQKLERNLERHKNKKLDSRLEITERKLIKCFRKEKKLKKILKRNNENTLANGKKLKRLTKQHIKQVEKQRKFVIDELQYQSISAAISIMTGYNNNKKKKKKRKNKKKKESTNKKSSKKKKSKKKGISFDDDDDDSDDSDESNDDDDDDQEPNRQQMEYFLEMMEEFPFLKFDSKAFGQIQDPMETILLETSTANVTLPDDDDIWYPHSHRLWSKLMDSPYASNKTGNRIILTKEEEKIASRFRKMLKLGIQKEAARMKMQAENIDIRIQCSVLGEELPEETSESSDAFGTGNSKVKKKKAKRYFHWQSLYHPDDIIKQKQMLQPVFEEEKKDETNPTISTTPITPSGGTDNYLSNELPEDEDGKKYIVESSIWMKASKQQFKNTFTTDDNAMKKHIEMYMKQPPAESAKRNSGSEDDNNNALMAVKNLSKKTDKANIVDLNRARNIDITLKSFNDFTNEELATIINYVDPKKKIKGDRLLLLNALLPTPIELKDIADYGDGPEYRLVQCEKWFKHLVKIKRIEDKASAMKTMGTFDDIVSFLDTNFTLVIQACDQVMTSQKLQDVLAVILEMGNQMNNPENQRDDDDDNNKNDLTSSAPAQLQPPNYNRSMSAPMSRKSKFENSQGGGQSGRRRKKIKDNKARSAPTLKGPKQAAGFHLEFLTQMSYTKGSDKTTTAIDLLVTILVEQQQRSTLLLKDDLPDCCTASDIQMTTLAGDLNLLDMSVNQLEKEYQTLQKENKKKWTPPSAATAKRGGGGVASKFGMNQALLANQLGKIHASRNNPGGEATARADMHNALQKELLAKKFVKAEQSSEPAASESSGGGGGKFDMHKELLAKKLGKIHNANAGEGPVEEADEAAGGGGKFNMHKELLAKKLGNVHAGGGPGGGGPPKSPGGGTASNTTTTNGGGGGDLDATIKRMGDFLGGAKGKVKDLKDKSEKARLACWKLSEFFCEPPSENSANSLFSILDEFCNNLDSSLKKCDERLGKEAKKKEKSAKAKAKVRNVVEDLKMNLRVTGMLQSLRKDADRWGVVRDKVLKGKKLNKKSALTQSAKQTHQDSDDDDDIDLRLVKSERQQLGGDVKGWDAIAAFVGSSNHSKAMKKRQVSKFKLSEQPSVRQMGRQSVRQSIRQSIQQEMSIRTVSPTRQRRSSLRNSVLRSMDPEGKSLIPPTRYAPTLS